MIIEIMNMFFKFRVKNLENTWFFSSNYKACELNNVHKKGQKRPIVIDGCNVAYHHGKHDAFSGIMQTFHLEWSFLRGT